MSPRNTGLAVKVRSQPIPPKSQRLPELSVQVPEYLRPPGELVSNVVDGGVLVPSGLAVFAPSIQVQSLWPQSTTTVLISVVAVPWKPQTMQPTPRLVVGPTKTLTSYALPCA